MRRRRPATPAADGRGSGVRLGPAPLWRREGGVSVPGTRRRTPARIRFGPAPAVLALRPAPSRSITTRGSCRRGLERPEGVTASPGAPIGAQSTHRPNRAGPGRVHPARRIVGVLQRAGFVGPPKKVATNGEGYSTHFGPISVTRGGISDALWRGGWLCGSSAAPFRGSALSGRPNSDPAMQARAAVNRAA